MLTLIKFTYIKYILNKVHKYHILSDLKFFIRFKNLDLIKEIVKRVIKIVLSKYCSSYKFIKVVILAYVVEAVGLKQVEGHVEAQPE